MANIIYKFIFLFLTFGLIESNSCFTASAMLRPDGVSLPGKPQIALNEIMADPSPVVGLPDKEYIELYNADIQEVNLKGWILEVGAKQKILPDISIPSQGFLLIVAPGGTAMFKNYGITLEISGFLINNSGAEISLLYPDKTTADRLLYLPALHRKGCEDGGYSLERIDPQRFCGSTENWCTTLSETGGTPGKTNSVFAVNRDNQPPVIEDYIFLNHSQLEIQLSEEMSNSLNDSKLFKIDSTDPVIDSLKYDTDLKIITLWFRPSSMRSGKDYRLTISGLKDECDNVMSDTVVKFGYYVPKKLEVVINEILFNPFPNGTDFVEIFNNSGYKVDLSDLFFAARDNNHGISQPTRLTTLHIFLPDQSFLAISKSTAAVEKFYLTKSPECLLQTDKLPVFPDEAGSVVLLNSNFDVLDEMEYSEMMHHPFLSQPEGVSLERIKVNGSSMDKANWHSASESAGFATPGYQNSVQEVADSLQKTVTIDPLVFTPNGDGINDELVLTVRQKEPGWLLNTRILDSSGLEKRRLTNNLFIGSDEKIPWNGRDESGNLVSPGIYIVSVSLFSKAGVRKSFKLACAVSDRL